MGLFDIFRPIDINEELENMKEIPEAVLLDVREADEYIARNYEVLVRKRNIFLTV